MLFTTCIYTKAGLKFLLRKIFFKIVMKRNVNTHYYTVQYFQLSERTLLWPKRFGKSEFILNIVSKEWDLILHTNWHLYPKLLLTSFLNCSAWWWPVLRPKYVALNNDELQSFELWTTACVLFCFAVWTPKGCANYRASLGWNVPKVLLSCSSNKNAIRKDMRGQHFWNDTKEETPK